MGRQEVEAHGKTIWPCAYIRDVFWRRDGMDAIEISVPNECTYDELARLSALLGTTNLTFQVETDGPYSEDTPGAGAIVTLEVRW